VVSIGEQAGAGEEAGWDPLISTPELASPDAATLNPPQEPEADPFAAFAAEEAARATPAAAPVSKPEDDTGSKS
jgi:hypothetical protein